jgi:hypothetical protein
MYINSLSELSKARFGFGFVLFCNGGTGMKVDKQQFDALLSALLKAPPTPMEAFKGKRTKKEPQTNRQKPPKK